MRNDTDFPVSGGIERLEIRTASAFRPPPRWLYLKATDAALPGDRAVPGGALRAPTEP
jgi:hypothetical protein